MTQPLRIGTRGSPLALWQAHHVESLLQPLTAPRSVELVKIQTVGDQVRNVPLSQLGGEGVFTKEIQNALLGDEVDVAVHSLKDLPTVFVADLVLAAVPQRGPVGDALVSLKYRTFLDLPMGAKVATSSLRRRSQLLYRRPDLRVLDIRGNVETRLRKLQDEDLDALVLAQAGLERLQFGEAITELLDASWMLPAVGQGALGLECRSGDAATRNLLQQITHVPSEQAVRAERQMLRALGGGCQVPIGAATDLQDGLLNLRGVVLHPSGSQRIEASSSGPAAEPEALGQQLAETLLAQGARHLLQAKQALPSL